MNPADLRLCGLVDGDIPALNGAAETARSLAGAGCTALIYRPPPSFRIAVTEVEAILAALSGTGVTVLIQERVDLALATGSNGVALGQADIHPRTARAMLGLEAIIALAIADPVQADELFRLPVDGAIVGRAEGMSTDSGRDLDHLGRLAFRAHLAAPGIAVLAAAGLSNVAYAHLIGAGADGVAVPAAAMLAQARGARSHRTEIDLALSQRGRP